MANTEKSSIRFLNQWSGLLLAFCIVFLLLKVNAFQHGLQTQEDAAMLLRYAGHLADGHGIVWNIGQAPVDGATDFLFMVLVAALSKLGLQLEVASLVLNLSAHFLTIFLVYRALLQQKGGTNIIAGISAFVLAFGPGLSYVEAGFGTTVFALAGLWSFLRFLDLLQNGYTARNAVWFAIASIITGLIRPEGVFLCLGMLASLAAKMEATDRKALLVRFALIFGIPGTLYFAWHWLYFGYPLPNPFYVKGGGSLYISSLKAALIGVGKMSFVLIPLFLYGIWKRGARTENLYLLFPVAFFVGIWILMSNAMNYNHRFQYVLMPILWVTWWPVLRSIWPDFELKGWRNIIVVGLYSLMLSVQIFMHLFQPGMFVDGRAELGRALAPLASKGYSMAITEAGNLPFYSDWNAIDTWGLNDKTISHAGIVHSAYLDQYQPDLVMIHDYWSPGLAKLRPQEKWAVMTDTLEAYLAARNYELVACWGRKPSNAHFYYLNRASKGYSELKPLIADFPYTWHEDGLLALNFLHADE